MAAAADWALQRKGPSRGVFTNNCETQTHRHLLSSSRLSSPSQTIWPSSGLLISGNRVVFLGLAQLLRDGSLKRALACNFPRVASTVDGTLIPKPLTCCRFQHGTLASWEPGQGSSAKPCNRGGLAAVHSVPQSGRVGRGSVPISRIRRRREAETPNQEAPNGMREACVVYPRGRP